MAVKVNCFSKSFFQQCLNFFPISNTKFFMLPLQLNFVFDWKSVCFEIAIFFFLFLVSDLLYDCTECDEENDSNNDI